MSLLGPCGEFLLGASFRGVMFESATVDGKYARRIVTHEYPGRDDPDHEDMGEQYQTFNVKGYVHGATARVWKDAVVAACRTPGPALLVLPGETPFLARCVNLSVTQNKDAQGWYDLNFEFRKEFNTASLLGFAIGEIEVLIGTAVSYLSTSLVSMLDGGGATGTSYDAAVSVSSAAVYSAATVADFTDSVYTAADMAIEIARLPFTVDNVLQYVADNAVARAQDFADTFASAIEATPITSTDGGSAMNLLATTLYTNAEAYCRSPAELLTSISEMLMSVPSGAAPEDAMATLKPFTTFSSVDPDFTGIRSKSERADKRNADLFNGAVRQIALGAYCQAVSMATLTSRSKAIQLRADIVEAIDREIEACCFFEDVVLALTQIRDNTVKYITEAIINAVPVIEITAPASMPAIYWAHRLYADPTRADEIIARNSIVDPAFTPTVFEALAR